MFNVREVYADAGYISKDNVNAVSKAGAIPFIDSRRNIHVPRKGKVTPWSAMLQLRNDNPKERYKHYGRRSTSESNFSAFKRKFVEYCRSKLPVSQKNEILAKIVCYNASILGKAMLKYDLNSGFLRRKKGR
ncbi:MAG: transposase [Candidatus Woesearchaeota archaeon]